MFEYLIVGVITLWWSFKVFDDDDDGIGTFDAVVIIIFWPIISGMAIVALIYTFAEMFKKKRWAK